jgi:hypothetical protein
VAARGLRLAPLELAHPLVLCPPGEHAAAEDVVVDLVARVPVVRSGRAEHALSRQRGEDGLEVVLGDARIACEVCGLVSDLRARWRDQVVEDPGSDVAIGRGEIAERSVEVVADDLLCSTERPEGRQSQHA